MARLAGRGESSLGVWRIFRFVEVRHVATDTSGRCPHKLAARVAGVAVQRGMGADECESREFQVIEPRTHPVVHRVALLAGDWHIQRDVIDAC